MYLGHKLIIWLTVSHTYTYTHTNNLECSSIDSYISCSPGASFAVSLIAGKVVYSISNCYVFLKLYLTMLESSSFSVVRIRSVPETKKVIAEAITSSISQFNKCREFRAFTKPLFTFLSIRTFCAC